MTRQNHYFPCWIATMLFAMAGCSEQAGRDGPPPPQVTVAKPLVKQITDWDEYTGRLAAVESVEMRARVSGYLESVHFRHGAIVQKDDLLFVIDPRPYQAKLDEAEAELTRARVKLQLAGNDLERAKRLFKSRAISEEELDSRTQEKREAVAARQAAKAAVQSTKLDVEFTHVRAPVSGRIGRPLVTKGNLVSGGTAGSTLLTTIVSLDPIHFYFTTDERAVLRYVRLDQSGGRPSSQDSPNPVRLKLADENDFVHQGHMDFVDNKIDQSTGTMQGRAIFENPDYLLVPGMFAEIKLLGEGPYEALLVPDAAVGADQAQRFVYLLGEKNITQRKPIVLGRLVGNLRVIREGLETDDRIVINGIQRIRPGTVVTPQAGEIADPDAVKAEAKSGSQS